MIFKLIKLGMLFGLIGFIAYSGILLSKPAFKNKAFGSDVREVLRVGARDAKEMKESIMQKVTDYKIPVAKEAVVVTGSGGNYHVTLKWSETVYITAFERKLYSKTYEFTVDEGNK